jgi:phospholipase C
MGRSRSNPNCESGHYYLLNNYNPGYFGDGTNAYTDTNPSNYVFTIPPSSVRNIGDALLEKNISFAYYGDQFNRYLNDKYDQSAKDAYCNICNFSILDLDHDQSGGSHRAPQGHD